MNYVSTTQAAEILNISKSRMRYLLRQGRVKGAYKAGKFWIVPLFEGNPIISRGDRGPKATWRRRQPAKTKIHVNRQNIRQNRNLELEDLIPVLSVKRYDSNIYGYSVKINGPCDIVYSPQKPLNCGAVLWVETFSQVEVKLTFGEEEEKEKEKEEDIFLIDAA